MLCRDTESAEKKEYVQLIPSYLAVISKMLKGRKQRNRSLIMGPGVGAWGGGCRGGIESICDCGRNLKENSHRPPMAAAALVASGCAKYSKPV